MKVRITEENILDALNKTSLSFDLKVFYKVLDKMPTAYYKKIVMYEFFEHLCGVKFFEVYDTVSRNREFFFSKQSLIGYTKKKKIASTDLLYEAMDSGSLIKKRYLVRSFSSSNDYVAPDVTSSDTRSVLHGSIDGTKTIDDAEDEGRS